MYYLSKSFCIAPSHGGRLALFVRDSGARLQLQTWFCRALLDLGCSGCFSEQDFRAALRRHVPESELPLDCARLLEELVEVGVLWPAERWRRFEAANARVELDWEDHGWLSAKLFHDSVVYSKFLQGDTEGWNEQLEAMDELRRGGEGPSVVKRYPPGLERVPLGPHGTLEHNLGEVLLRRRTGY